MLFSPSLLFFTHSLILSVSFNTPPAGGREENETGVSECEWGWAMSREEGGVSMAEPVWR